jgi:hypothetical protein
MKNNFKKIKNIILMYFQMKNTLKNNHNYTFKQAFSYPNLKLCHGHDF